VDKLKGIVDECSTTNTWNKQREKACVYNLLLPETDMDLSKMRLISNGMLSTKNPFSKYQGLDRMKFSRAVIETNAEKFIGRSNCSKNKKKKMTNHCSRCIFQCDSKLINTDNVENKCCLTYDQALKSGFFKDLSIKNTTSIYETGVYVDDCKIGGYGDNVTLHENKYTKFK
jgi:hypothetical protein